MSVETNLWLIRHAPVDGPRGVIHGPDAPADLGNAAAFAALKARLPTMLTRFAVRGAARGKPRAELGLDPVEEPDFAEQEFGAWTGRHHDDLAAELGTAYQDFWKSAAGSRPPGGESFVDQIERARAGLARLPAGDAVLVVHSGTIRAVLAIALDLAPDHALRFVIDPLSLTRIDRLKDGWRVGVVNQDGVFEQSGSRFA